MIDTHLDITIRLSDLTNPMEIDVVHRQIKAYNDANSLHFRDIRKTGKKPLCVYVYNIENQIIGGLVAATYWGWLEIEELWLDESIRGYGYGGQVLKTAEDESIRRGCHHVMLRTYSFQAKEFYKKNGYLVVGEMQDYPPGEIYYWMRKDL